MKKLSIFLTSLFVGLSALLVAAPQTVHAQVSVCTFIRPICTAIGLNADGDLSDAGSVAQTFVTSRLSLVLSLVFVGIVLLAVFVIIRASIQYIQSQGDESKIQDATKAIKSVFIGIAALFIGIVGMFLVAAFFNGVGIFAPGGDNDGTGSDRCVINAETGRLECGDLE